MVLHVLPVFTALSLLTVSSVSAQTQPQGNNYTQSSGDTSFAVGDTISIVGTRFIDSSRALTSVDRMSPDVAQNTDFDYAWQLVGKMPGIMLTEFNQGTTSGKLSFRGFNGEGSVNAVKLLIDGIPANTNDGNMPFIDMIFPIEIDAVEVIRGTNDPRYGLNNIAGNVAFATRSGGNYLDGRVTAGSFGAYQAEAAMGIASGNFTQNYAVGYREKEGYREHSELDKKSISGKWGYGISSDTEVTASARHYQANAEEPGYLTADVAYSTPNATNTYNESDKDARTISQYSLALGSQIAAHTHFNTLAWLNEYKDDRFVKFSALASQQNRLSKEKHYGASTSLTYTPKIAAINALLVEVGASIENQDVVSKRYLTNERVVVEQTRDQDFDLSVKGLYIQTMIEPTSWLRITPAIRVDWIDGGFYNALTDEHADINDYGAIKQPKLSLAVISSEQITIFANWGKTYQIGTNSGAYLIGARQKHLAPSINEGWESGVKWKPSRDSEIRIALWQQTATGEFKRKLNDPLGDFDNLGATKRKGIDIQASWSPTNKFSLWGAFAWQQAQIDIADPSTPEYTGNNIDHIPNRLLTAGIDYQLTTQLNLAATLRTQSDYELTPSNSQGRYGDFTQLGLKASYDVNSALMLSAQVDNLTDEYYEYVWWDGSQTLHSPAQGRAVSAAIKFKY
ncbi:TonB-dependent receptor [Pseudoalteromonas rhizosphaerae]|uniref:TonB-dependent receptor n=1 Tax=Pseudoalteromonas rhizosphaerae TaxID=2518973 RepID=UPI0015D3F0FA|nr:TonB-dependent receptor [Pseudoalteromonas rhizosphaerae]